jgi:ubiquinone/menaquinone biosynthesis C-methylase UbiE
MQKADMTNQDYLLHEHYRDSSRFTTCLELVQHLGAQPVDWYHWIFDLLKPAPHCRLLELGCGPGFLWKHNLQRIPPDWDITLSDFSPGMLQDARNQLQPSGRNFTFQVIDAQQIPFAENHFDRVIANCMLYHVPDRARALAEVRRVLKPGGVFYAATFSDLGFSLYKELTAQAGLPLWKGELGFSLENGAAQLARQFSQIDLQRMANMLVIKDTDGLLAWIRAIPCGLHYDEATILRLREVIQQKIAQCGEVHIDMEIGLFLAS